MDVALIIIISLLIAFAVVIAVRGRLASRPAREQEEAEARVTAGKAEVQHEESLRRRAGVRAAHARAKREDSDTDE